MFSFVLIMFLFKQKTAYEIRISDWKFRRVLFRAKDEQLAREVEFSIPRELNQQQGIQLAREFVEKQFVERVVVADMNVHWDMGQDGQPKPHARSEERRVGTECVSTCKSR